jgi:hypothetical protein
MTSIRTLLTRPTSVNLGKILGIPIFATTQLRAKLGETDPDLLLDAPDGYKTNVHADKSLFSMWTPEVRRAIYQTYPERQIEAVIVGIESHICVTQTTLDLLKNGHKVYVLADGVSSCNKEEVPIALARLRAEGAVVTTSESWIYESMADASIEEFRAISKLVRDSKDDTTSALGALCKI